MIHLLGWLFMATLYIIVATLVACVIGGFLYALAAAVAALARHPLRWPQGGPTTSHSRPPIPLALRTRVLDRDGWQCVYCGSKKDLQIDHIIPFSRGGATTFENLEVLCGECNKKKGAA